MACLRWLGAIVGLVLGISAAAGSFGPIGTLPAHRGRGLGAILLRRCLRDLHHGGHRRAIVPWIAPGSERFYARVATVASRRVYAVLEIQGARR